MMTSDDIPTIKEIHEVKMYNPDTDETEPIKRADFEGITHIFKDDQVEELRDNGWFTRGLTAKVGYKNRVYEVTVSGNSKIGYVKIDDVEEPDIGRELHTIIRNAFLENFRIYPEVRDISM